MQLFRGLQKCALRLPGSVVTIGNFDGVHLGHQIILQDCQQKAAALGLPTVVMIFEPQPLEFFKGAQAPARLSNLREKLMALGELDIDNVLCVRFDRAFSEIGAEDFIQHVLVDRLGVRYLCVGDDFRFGRARQGDFAMLQAAGRADGFQVEQSKTVLYENARVSSTRIRADLAKGDFTGAKALLGRPYTFTGKVVHGAGRGSAELNMPTANIRLKRRVTPLSGVFVVSVYGAHPTRAIRGVACVGERPMIDTQHDILEVHLLDFSGVLYGKTLSVEFVTKIRDQQRFESLAALQAQMHADRDYARRIE